MRSPRKLSPLGWGVLAVVVICVIVTGIIVWNLIARIAGRSDVRSTEAVEQYFDNAYITAADQGKIEFLSDGLSYTVEGTMETPYIGVADIVMKEQKITQIKTKPDTAEGILESYTEDTMKITGYGIVKRGAKIPVYDKSQDTVVQKNLEDLIIGYSNVTYVLEGDTVEAILTEEITYSDSLRVLIKNGTKEHWEQITLEPSGSYQILFEDGTLEEGTGPMDPQAFLTERNSTRMELISPDGEFTICEADGTRSDNGYPGKMICLMDEGQIILVNQVEVEAYVKRVVPSEMPASYSIEALKAQAVCARTFAYSQMTNTTYAKYGANLDDTTAFQVYNQGERKESTDLAVEETAHQVIKNSEGLITCYYFSTSPGYTENFQVWQGESPDYLVPVNCTDGVMRDLSRETEFADFLVNAPGGFDAQSPFYRWSAQLDGSLWEDPAYGTIQALEVTKRSASGYVLELKITSAKGSHILYNENEIRAYLGRILVQVDLNNGTIRKDFNYIPSACFRVESVQNGQWLIRGGGFGHGIGMSQYGADAMGDLGMDYTQIIQFYYTNVTIEPVYQPV